MAEKKMMVVVGAKTSAFEKAMKGMQKSMKSVSRQMTSIGKGTTTAITLPIVAVGGTAIKAFGDFEKAMSGSTAVMDDLSDEMRNSMETVARDVAKTTRFSATDAAESYYFLASAGLDAVTSIEALPKVAAFAQAGNFDMARATDLLTDAQSALGLSVDDTAQNIENMARVSDVLTQAQVLANGSTEQFSTALTSKAGKAIETVGKEIEEGVAALAVFADQGIKGEAAGTLLSNTLFGLSDRARESQEDFKRLGIEVFDAEGNMKNLADIASDFETALGGLNTEQKLAELANMGFNKQAREGILALVGNSEALQGYESDLRSAGGVTGEIADNQLDNLWDQLGLLKDRVWDAAIELGSTLAPIIQDTVIPLVDKLIGFISKVVEWFANLSPGTRQVIIVILGLVAAIGPLLVVAGTLIGALANMMPLFSFIGSTLIPKLIGVFSLLLGPIGLVIAAIAAAIAIGVLLWKNWDKIKEFAGNLWGTIKEKFAGIKETITGTIKSAGDFVGKQIDRIKGFFNFKWEFPKLKLPKFSISGSANPLKWITEGVPKLKVTWNAVGGVMTRPTIFGGAGNTLFAGGEAGNEGIVPLQGRHMMPLADAIADRLSGKQQVELAGTLTIQLTNDKDEIVGIAQVAARDLLNDSSYVRQIDNATYRARINTGRPLGVTR